MIFEEKHQKDSGKNIQRFQNDTLKASAYLAIALMKKILKAFKQDNLGEVEIKVDGKTVFQGILPKETEKTWEADKHITVEAANAGLILLTFNEQKTKRFGKLGENKKVTYQLTKVSP